MDPCLMPKRQRQKYQDSARRQCQLGDHDLLEDGEEERSITGFPYYTCTSLGRVISYQGISPRILKTAPNSRGYLQANAVVDGRYRVLRVHIVVCQAFHGDKPDGCTLVRHLNDNRMDNRSANLAYGTHADNARDALVNRKIRRGSSHKMAKITEDQAREIKIEITNGKSNTELAHRFNLSPATIRLIRIGQNWAHIQI